MLVGDAAALRCRGTVYSREGEMARYFFHVSNAAETEGENGEEYASLDEAKRSASEVARELGRNRREGEIRGKYVRVTDESGCEVFRTALTNK
jgi:hypothetical protein